MHCHRIRISALSPYPVATTAGLSIVADAGLEALAPPIDTLILAGGAGARAAADNPALVAHVTRLAAAAPRVASVCTGAFPLAATGLLDGRRAVTHWAYCDLLQRRHPAIRVEPDAIFVTDGKVHSSAGVTAGIDLALALVERDHGAATALAIARRLVVFLRRPGGQSQFSSHLLAGAGTGPFADLVGWMQDHPDADLTVEALAGRAAMSPRTFARRFAEALGLTPGQYVLRLRLDAARRLLTEGALPVGGVARRCGFGMAEAMRLAFQRQLGIAPQQFRERFRPPAASPPASSSMETLDA